MSHVKNTKNKRAYMKRLIKAKEVKEVYQKRSKWKFREQVVQLISVDRCDCTYVRTNQMFLCVKSD